MPERQQLEALFLDNLAAIERIAASICRRHGLSREDTEDFTSSAEVKLVEDDYAVLSRFRGDSSITTYLAVVLAMLFRDYRAQQWGRWRPSAVARSHGPVAVRLETLVHRDGYSLDEAAEVLRSSGASEISPRELGALYAKLPPRAPLRPVDVGPEPLGVAAATGGADDLLLAHVAEVDRRNMAAALQRALEQLPVEDRLILRMRFWGKLSVADIARGLNLQQKGLYRRINGALTTLREQLEATGISREQAQQIFTDEILRDG